MKVCLLNDSFPPVIDGVANVVKNYAGVMTEKQLAEVMVGTPRYPDADYSGYPYKVVPYQSFDTTEIVSGYRAGNPLHIKAIREMADFAPDIIHTHCPVASTVMGRILRNEVKAPMIFTYHTKFDVDIARAVNAEFLQKEVIRMLVNNIEASDEIWVVSQGAGENLRSLGYEGEYRVVSNGVDFAKGRAAAEKVAEATKGYDLPENVPVFLFVGRLMKYKGLPLILDALAILKQQNMDFRMVFVGDGADAQEMKQKAADCGIADHVIFTGAIKDREVLRAWNTRADLFLFPSVYDTNGIVVREAAACGIASVLIKDSCAAEGVTHGRNGYIIEETPQSMAALLSEVCQDMDRVHQVGQNAMDEIYISWEQSVRDAHRRYEEVIDLHHAGKLPTKMWNLSEHLQDDFSEAWTNMKSDVQENYQKLVLLQNHVHEGMMENMYEAREEIRVIKKQIFNDIKEIFTDDEE